MKISLNRNHGSTSLCISTHDTAPYLGNSLALRAVFLNFCWRKQQGGVTLSGQFRLGLACEVNLPILPMFFFTWSCIGFFLHESNLEDEIQQGTQWTPFTTGDSVSGAGLVLVQGSSPSAPSPYTLHGSWVLSADCFTPLVHHSCLLHCCMDVT